MKNVYHKKKICMGFKKFFAHTHKKLLLISDIHKLSEVPLGD